MFVSEVARELSKRNRAVIRPRDISDLFYKRLLPDDRCPVQGGRRKIPHDFVPVIEESLRRRGLIPDQTAKLGR